MKGMAMLPKDEIDPEVLRKLQTLKAIAPRDARKTAEGHAAFMEIAKYELEGVSPMGEKRHNGWKRSKDSNQTLHRKEHSRMFNFITTLIVVLGLLVGASGVTVAAAQSSQPDQALYSVKLLSEDVRLTMAGNPETQYQLSMEFASRRAAEIQTMLQAGEVPGEAVQTRYQNELEQAVRFASELPTAQAIQALQQIQERLQTQQQALLKVQVNGSPTAEAALLRNREMIMQHLKWVQDGLADPTKFKDQLQNEEQNGNGSPAVLPSQAAVGNGEGNPWTTGTPTPLSGYGPGPGPSTTATPEGYFGPGPKPTDIPEKGGKH
jgi:hypothetical protein